MELHTALSRDLRDLRKLNPLILNITNHVAMDFSANALLAIGASPVMSQDVRELDELTAASSAVVVNMGTLNDHWLELAHGAIRAAERHRKPIIFDPVGSGATTLRTATAKHITEKYPLAVVRGNASEIASLFARQVSTKGVDSSMDPEQALDLVQQFRTGHSISSTFVISGSTDYIAVDDQTYFVRNGHPAMTLVTAMGCVATCVIAALRCVEPKPDLAAFKAMAVMGLCGELAAEVASGPGSLKMRFLDLLASDDLPLQDRLKVGRL